MNLEKLSNELKEGKTVKEVLNAIEAEGRELSDDDLQSVAGGHMWDEQGCPQCGSVNTEWDSSIPVRGNIMTWVCRDCGYKFEIDGLAVKEK